jgi:hypothetical protein
LPPLKMTAETLAEADIKLSIIFVCDVTLDLPKILNGDTYFWEKNVYYYLYWHAASCRYAVVRAFSSNLKKCLFSVFYRRNLYGFYPMQENEKSGLHLISFCCRCSRSSRVLRNTTCQKMCVA